MKRQIKIGDWPFGPSGVDCRTCLRAPCRCPVWLFLGEAFYDGSELVCLACGLVVPNAGQLDACPGCGYEGRTV